MSFSQLRNRILAVDAMNILHEFLALIRQRDGRPLTDPSGRVTSHLEGLIFRYTRLLQQYNIMPVFVFDGKPPPLKAEALRKRRDQRDKASRQWTTALAAGDHATAFSKATMTGRLTSDMLDDAIRVLRLLGFPTVQAPSEGEAQAAYMTRRGDVWACNSKDYDSLLFGAPRLVRFLTLTGREYLPSRGEFRRLTPEVIRLADVESSLGITREQLIDVAILVGTDYNEGVKGIGSRRALKLILTCGKLENLPSEIRKLLPECLEEVRHLFLNPPITDDYQVEFSDVRADALVEFLCGERGFSRQRVLTAVKRMEDFHRHAKQTHLADCWQMGS